MSRTRGIEGVEAAAELAWHQAKELVPFKTAAERVKAHNCFVMGFIAGVEFRKGYK